ncbi:hypothetical protein V6Z11_A04G056200 [Gossypium hirsutum]
MISNLEANHTLATLGKVETNKLPLLPLYRTIYEIFTSYLFNSFKSHWVIFLIRESPPFFHSVLKSN